jgi:hypothetical protein
MSLTVIQNPGNINAAYTRLLTVVSGSIYTAQPQFQYVCDVYDSGSNTLLKRMTQPLNPAGTATFDVARIIQGELSVDYNWKINTPTQFDSSSRKFAVRIGEQFSTSISSSVTVYPDQYNLDLTAFQGVVEPNAGTYNFVDVVDSNVLSNMPSTMSMQSDDFGTISTYSAPTSVSQSFYSASSAGYVKVDEKNYTAPGINTAFFSSFPISSSADYWNYVDVSISSSFGIENYRYEASDETHREKTRFAFVNKLGAWDYYNNYNPVRQAINVSREQYTAPRVDYSSRLSTYDISRRGKKDYHNSTDDLFTVDTDLLDKENANWLEELIESPEVYIQRNGEFIPIVITDTSYTSNQNQARQKQFKYTINFKPSNQPFGTWIPEYVSCPKFQPKPPVVITEPFTNIGFYNFDLNGSVVTDGGATVTERGFAYSSQSANPSITGSTSVKVTAGTGIGDFSSAIVSASEDKVYYARAYASNSMGLVYGDVEQATTNDYVPITVTSLAPTEVGVRVFTMEGTVNDGTSPIVERGFVLSKTDTSPEIGQTDVLQFVTGSTAGSYDYYLSGSTYLTGSTTYNYRAYGSSSTDSVIYGSTINFDTSGSFYVFSRCSDDVLKRSSFQSYTQDIAIGTRVKEAGVYGYESYYITTGVTGSTSIPIIN